MEAALVPRFLWHLWRVRGRERWPRRRIEAFQAEALQRVRERAYATSTFYREHHRGLESAPLQALPAISKRTLMSRFDDIVADRRVRLHDVWRHMIDKEATGEPYLGRYRIMTTSGSTGEVTVMLADPAEHIYSFAGTSRTRAFAGLPWNPLRPRRAAAIAGSLPWLSSTQLTKTEQNARFAPLLRLSSGDPLESIVARLNAWQPEIIGGYTSILAVLADEQLAGRLRIQPRLVSSGGETMGSEIRRRIRAAWGRDPFDYYGTVEGGTHAIECAEGRRMHVMDDFAILEVVNDDHRPVAPGELGSRVLVTTLWRTTLPLIRYEITDAVRMGTDPCVCGRPFPTLAEIQGRTSTVLRLPATDGSGYMQIPRIALINLIGNLPVVWRAVTQEDDRLIVSTVGLPDDFDTSALIRSLHQALGERGVRPVPVEFRRLATIPRAAAGKALVEPPPDATGAR